MKDTNVTENVIYCFASLSVYIFSNLYKEAYCFSDYTADDIDFVFVPKQDLLLPRSNIPSEWASEF